LVNKLSAKAFSKSDYPKTGNGTRGAAKTIQAAEANNPPAARHDL
jgi:hypothetical protein